MSPRSFGLASDGHGHCSQPSRYPSHAMAVVTPDLLLRACRGQGVPTVLLALCSALLMSGATCAGAELHFSAVTPAFFHAG